MASLKKRTDYIYTKELIDSLKKNGFDYILNDKVVSIINKIAKQVGAPTYKKTPIFKKYNKNKKRHKKVQELSNDEWELLRTFETGKVIKNIEGINKDINIIYGYLNKLTQDTYDDLKQEIIDKMDQLIIKATKEDLLILGTHIFEIGSNNRFYSNLYADLFKVLIIKFTIFKEIFDYNYKNIIKMFDNIEIADESNYEHLCKVNKDNEKRRAMIAFMINLMNIDIIKTDEMIIIINKFINMLQDNCKEDGNKPLCNELGEIITIISTLGYDKLYHTNRAFIDKLEKIITDIAEYEVKSKTCPSLTNKVVFKFMDLVDDIFNS